MYVCDIYGMVNLLKSQLFLSNDLPPHQKKSQYSNFNKQPKKKIHTIHENVYSNTHSVQYPLQYIHYFPLFSHQTKKQKVPSNINTSKNNKTVKKN